MLERFIQIVRTDAPGSEEPAATRDRLKARFAPGAVRRMTQLGMFVGAVLGELQPGEADALVYATQFGEGRALEGYLDSFPGASPTLFQTSIHPSGAQQGLIGRQRSVREFFPLAGGNQLVATAMQAALLAHAERVLFCGGEERGTWLVPHGAASDRAFAFALALTRVRAADSIGRLALEPIQGVADEGRANPPGEPRLHLRQGSGGHVGGDDSPYLGHHPTGSLALPDWFELLHNRRPYAGTVAPGWRLTLEWQ